jgi:hypothetical protein
VIRQAAIALGIERQTDNVGQVGGDELLLASQRHSLYIIEAHRRRKLGLPGYQTFAIAERKVQPGDIIVQDRDKRTPQNVTTYADIPSIRGRILHGDIVIDVQPDHCVAIGGNLTGSVRFRFYPIRNGVLTLMHNEKFVQQDSEMPVPHVPVNSGNGPAANLPDFSTLRIFALLGLVEPTRTDDPGLPELPGAVLV